MEHDLRVYAKGEAFDGGKFDLRKLELLVGSYRQITDRLIAVQMGRRQLSPKIKDQIDYEVRVNTGSIEMLIDFAFTNKEILGTLAADGGYQLSSVVTKLFRSAIDLRKEVSAQIAKGLPITININTAINTGNGVAVASSGNGPISINDPKILWAAQTTRYPADRLISGVDGKLIEYVESGPKDEQVKYTTDDRVVLGQAREELNSTLKIQGTLDMISFSSHRGVILSDGERFPVTWDEQIRSKMQKVADVEGIAFTVRPIVDEKRLHSNAIAYHVLNCEDPQNNLDL